MDKTKPLILAGLVPANSFLRDELGIEDVFSLRIGTMTYREHLENLFQGYELVFEEKKPILAIKEDNVYDAFEYRSVVDSPDYIDLHVRENVFSLLLQKTPARNFNTFHTRGAFLENQCRRSLKAQQEYTFLSQVPESLQKFFPKVKDFKDLGEYQKYEIELVPYFDFGKIFLHTSIPLGKFKILIECLEQYRRLSPKVEISAADYRQKLMKLFVEKLHYRVQELQTLPKGPAFISEFYVEKVVAMLSKRIESKIQKMQETQLLFSHGDLCFSNILFDAKTRTVKLVDPRGINRPDEAYLPWYYDLAKLSHSVYGLYDMTINGVPFFKNEQQEVFIEKSQKIFLEWVQSNNWDYELMRLCEASLFISMIPFHIQNKEHASIHFRAGLSAMKAVQ